MGGEGADEAKVPNPYRAAIVSAKASSIGPAATLTSAFDRAVSAIEAGAWVGGTADTFADSITGYRSSAKTAATNSIQEFDDAISGEPEMVAMNSWQVHWHNLGP